MFDIENSRYILSEASPTLFLFSIRPLLKGAIAEIERVRADLGATIDIIAEKNEKIERLQNRCDALERCIKSDTDTMNLCETCKNLYIPGHEYPCLSCSNENLLWKFNEQRFGGEVK